MEIRVICIGKIKNFHLQELINEYAQKINNLHKFKIIELAEVTYKDESNAVIKEILHKEAELISKYLVNSYNIALCIEAKMLSSEQLASHIQQVFNYQTHHKYINFIIGSSYGLDQIIKNQTHLNLSLAKITLNHQLARLVLLEQIYRILTIMHHINYHK